VLSLLLVLLEACSAASLAGIAVSASENWRMSLCSCAVRRVTAGVAAVRLLPLLLLTPAGAADPSIAVVGTLGLATWLPALPALLLPALRCAVSSVTRAAAGCSACIMLLI
jgi:hypothetical protein